jgi:hypothetical protein
MPIDKWNNNMDFHSSIDKLNLFIFKTYLQLFYH